MRACVFAAILVGLVPQSAVAADGLVGPIPKTVTLSDSPHTTIVVEAGELKVPESRGNRASRRLSLPFYRLKSTAKRPAAPIFLLAGGPGSSWLDQFETSEENFREVLFYRSIADVVLFDQRGGGRSQPQMHCPQSTRLPADQPLELERVRAVMRTALAQCRDQWLAAGVDLKAYNTVESAADVDALRQALGYETMTLVGGSYGSHLALQIMRAYPQTVARALLFGIEGPDHTWDDPDAILAALARIAADVEGSGALLIPKGGLLQALARVLDRLAATPQRVLVETESGSREVVVDAVLVRRIADHRAGRRSTPLAWPEFISGMDRGDFALAAQGALAHRNIPLDDPMHYSMDCASGISPERRQRYRSARARAVLGDINFEYASLCDLWPHRDLGAAFRAPVVSDIPTVIVHSDWDLSTPIENAREVAATLKNAQLIEVRGGHHGALYNLYEHWPPMHRQMRAFLSGGHPRLPAEVQMPSLFPAAPSRFDRAAHP
jgi:pimeloyl-ACP methyl ester carboxylesterase